MTQYGVTIYFDTEEAAVAFAHRDLSDFPDAAMIGEVVEEN